MPTRDVVLTAHQESLVAALVDSGRYHDASEVLREGLRLLQAREEREAAKLNALQEAARLGFGDLDEGRYRELRDEELDAFITDLGQRAAGGIAPSGR